MSSGKSGGTPPHSKMLARLLKRRVVLTFCVRSIPHLLIFARASWLK
jgi:hypothetical protein